ncbi:ABC transporter substrate-binding protein [Desulfocurvibacter africanus]|uniref:ABC-type transporter, periplasmic subunit family 3 n=1 Tax=Desulfocurvibacter africanus subsp. africanus str. Walvis Bay TaxID=690850 RepID=F3YWT2_DESAF|nr:ABC transporter substrate-binding protein [Desulfocurvibacter africanus]EGJ51656.1 ABC-type transporter, periplasmic subunit family 3 [Desulfocurvibacter africanus subsp. africanus str. Walvis Bay]
MRLVKAFLVVAAVALCCASSAFAESTYDKVMKAKVLRAGIMTNSIPGAFYNEKKEWVGFDVDIAEEVAKRLGVKLERVQVSDMTRISFVQQGRIDMSVANMTHKRERDKSIDFSITYFFDGQKLLVKKDSGIKDWKDIVAQNKKIASTKGTTSEVNARNKLKQLGDKNADQNVISFPDYAAAFQALKNGRVAGFTTDSTILLGYAAQASGQFELVGDFISDEPYGIGLPENDSKWRDAINFALQDMWADGTYKKIYDKWYGPDTPYYFPLTAKIEMWP